MKFERTDSFRADWRGLSEHERDQFRSVIKRFHLAAERRVASEDGRSWPRALRVKAVTSAPGIWEMTLSFSGPDGRATFEWVEIDAAPAMRWRRIGGHEVFGRP